jgi:hypothetical protein
MSSQKPPERRAARFSHDSRHPTLRIPIIKDAELAAEWDAKFQAERSGSADYAAAHVVHLTNVEVDVTCSCKSCPHQRASRGRR